MAENLLSRIGTGIASAIAKVAPTVTLGSSQINTNEIAGLFQRPDRDLRLLGQLRYIEFDLMVRDVSIVAAGVRLFLNLISNAVWTVNPPENLNANEEAVAKEYADFMYDQIFGMTNSWSSVVRKAAGFRLQGFAILEWTAKRTDDGQIGLLDIEHRPQRTIARWLRDTGGTIEAVIQQVSGKPEVTLPRSKIVYAVDDVLTDSPEGIGLYRHLYATADRLREFLELEEIGFQTDLRGIPIARAPLAELQTEVINAGPEGSDQRAIAEGKRQLKLSRLVEFIKDHIRNKHQGMMLPSDVYLSKSADGAQTPSATPKWAIELLNGDSTSFDSMANAVNRMNQELARILGVEHLLLGADRGGGSLALARAKVGTFYLTVTSTMLDLVEVFDRDIIAPIAQLNGWDPALWPQFGVNEISDRDLDEAAGVLLKIAQAGAPMMPDDPAIGEMRDALGLSRPNEETVKMALDASLKPTRTDPGQTDLNKNPEDGIAKGRMMRARPRKRRRR